MGVYGISVGQVIQENIKNLKIMEVDVHCKG